MEYVAMEWDHTYSERWVRWVVMECAGLQEEENGAIQALKPRRDIAYFLREDTAEEDASLFASMRNGKSVTPPQSRVDGYRAYPWDHSTGEGVLQWAVLRSEPELRLGRADVAYFVNPESAQSDAELFANVMNQATGR